MAHNLRSNLRSRENSPTVRNNKTNPDNAVEVYCRIRHVNGIIETSSDEASDITADQNNNFDDQRIAACKTLDSKTVSLNTIDKRNNLIEQTTHYTFTKAFSSSVNQQTIFDNVCRPQVDRLISGQNALLFAYGVTGSGKTYTMMGKSDAYEDIHQPSKKTVGTSINFKSRDSRIRDQNAVSVIMQICNLEER